MSRYWLGKVPERAESGNYHVLKFGQTLMQAHVEKCRKPLVRLHSCLESKLKSPLECSVLADNY